MRNIRDDKVVKYEALDICKLCDQAELVNNEKVCASCNHPD